MEIDQFKTLSIEQKLNEIKYRGNILGAYDRNGEQGGTKTPGDIYELFDFWVFLSDDEQMIIPSRRNPLPEITE